MKRIAFSLMAAALLAGCSAIEDSTELEAQLGSGMTFTASFDDEIETRTFLNDEGKQRWNADDRVSIFVGNTKNRQFAFAGATGDVEGDFTDLSASGFGSYSDLTANYAVYPYSPQTSISAEGMISLILPAEQTYCAGSFGIGANTAVSVTENTDDTVLKFKNVGGFIKLQLYGNASVSSIVLKGNDGEKIAGDAQMTLSYGGTPETEVKGSGTETITLDCGDGVALGVTAAEATAFYIVIPPVEFAHGFTVTITSTDHKVMEKSTSKKFTVRRNVITPMAAFEYKGDGSASINIPDPAFKAYCVANFDKNGDGEISVDEAAVVKRIDCSVRKISSLEGIEYFTALSALYCFNNQLSSLDISKNTALTYIDCYRNQLTSIDVSNSTALTYLNCNTNRLTRLDVSNNTALTRLICYTNPLMSLDVGKNTALTYLDCYGNQLTRLDVSKNTALTYLECDSNLLTSLDVSNSTALEHLNCSVNQLTSLDVSKNTALTYLNCFNNQLRSLDVSNNADLSYLDTYNNPDLAVIWLKTGQSISDLFYDSDVSTIKRK